MSARCVAAALIFWVACGAGMAKDNAPSETSRRIDGPADYSVFWDEPETGVYWVPKGTPIAKIIEAGKACGATVDGGVSHHIPVPPQYDVSVFHFVGPTLDVAKQCVMARVEAVPALTVYPKKK